MGIQASGMTGAAVTNSGDIGTNAYYAYGVFASAGTGDATITNAYGGIDRRLRRGVRVGALGRSSDGNVSIDNAGDMGTYALGQSVGIAGISSNGDVGIDNSGSDFSYSRYSSAWAGFARADNGAASIDNSGSMFALAYYGDAAGGLARGQTVDVTNTVGDPYGKYGIVGLSVYGDATGVDAFGVDSTSISNGSLIGASTKYGGLAMGVYAASLGDVTIDNTLDGAIYSDARNGPAFGVYSFSVDGDTTVAERRRDLRPTPRRSASMQVRAMAPPAPWRSPISGYIEATGSYGAALGVLALAGGGDIDIRNLAGGYVDATAPNGNAFGINAYAYDGHVGVDNAGTIVADGYAGATGIYAVAYGDVAVSNMAT